MEKTASSKWQDPEFLRVYKREYKRRVEGKRHPNIMEDGRLYSEVHPFGEFKSIREKYDAIKNKYRGESTPREECGICGSVYYVTQREKHLTTKKHEKAQLFYNKGLEARTEKEHLGNRQVSSVPVQVS